MQVNRSGYYAYLQRKAESKFAKEKGILVEVKALAKVSKNSYGTRRISNALKEKGYKVGRYKTRRLMKEAGIEVKRRRKFVVTTQSDHCYKVAENTLNRQFEVAEPNTVWGSDITYVWTQEGWLYVAIVMDLFSRRIVGWSVANTLASSLAERALEMAIGRRQPTKSVLHHSDRGCQYASSSYQEKLKESGMVCSMSRKGNCWDNAVVERFFGSMKGERTSHVQYRTFDEAKADIIDYIEMFYNSNRLHSTLNYQSPMQYEQMAGVS
jgi:putative transposase